MRSVWPRPLALPTDRSDAVCELAAVRTRCDGDTLARATRDAYLPLRHDVNQPAGSPFGSQQAQSQPQPRNESRMQWCWADATSYITGTEIVIDGGNLQTL